MNLMQISLAFIVGFLLGGLGCYIAYTKIFSKQHLQDELTSTRRELARAKRSLSDFFTSADAAFAQLDKNYREFAALLRDGAGRLSQNPDLFVPDEAGTRTAKGKLLPGRVQIEEKKDVLLDEDKPRDLPEQEGLVQAAAKSAADSTNPKDGRHEPAPETESGAPVAPESDTAAEDLPEAAPAAGKAAAKAAAVPDPSLDAAAANSQALNGDEPDDEEIVLTEPPKDFVVEKKEITKI